MARRRSKAARIAGQPELDVATRPGASRKPARTPADVERAARLAIARRGQRAGAGDKVKLALTLFLSRKHAERLAARAIREEKNLDALAAEILEDAPE